MENITKLANHSLNNLNNTYNELVEFEETFDSNIDNLTQADPVTLITTLHNISNVIGDIIEKVRMSLNISRAIRDISATNDDGVKFENYLHFVIEDNDKKCDKSNSTDNDSSLASNIINKYIDLIGNIISSLSSNNRTDIEDTIKEYISNLMNQDDESKDKDTYNDINEKIKEAMKPVGDNDVIPTFDPNKCSSDSDNDNEKTIGLFKTILDIIISQMQNYTTEGVFNISHEDIKKFRDTTDELEKIYITDTTEEN